MKKPSGKRVLTYFLDNSLMSCSLFILLRPSIPADLAYFNSSIFDFSFISEGFNLLILATGFRFVTFTGFEVDLVLDVFFKVGDLAGFTGIFDLAVVLAVDALAVDFFAAGLLLLLDVVLVPASLAEALAVGFVAGFATPLTGFFATAFAFVVVFEADFFASVFDVDFFLSVLVVAISLRV